MGGTEFEQYENRLNRNSGAIVFVRRRGLLLSARTAIRVRYNAEILNLQDQRNFIEVQ